MLLAKYWYSARDIALQQVMGEVQGRRRAQPQQFDILPMAKALTIIHISFKRGNPDILAEPRDAALPGLGPQEGQQVGVDLILMRGREAVRCAWIVDFLRALDEPGRFLRRVLDGYDLVVLTVHDQGRDIELLEVLGEISLGEGLDAFIGVLEAGLHAPDPELIQDSL